MPTTHACRHRISAFASLPSGLRWSQLPDIPAPTLLSLPVSTPHSSYFSATSLAALLSRPLSRRSPLPVLFVSSRSPRRSIRAGEPPDGSTYQDGYGKTRKWTKDEMEGREGFRWSNPRTWFGYGKLTEISVSPPTADSAA